MNKVTTTVKNVAVKVKEWVQEKIIIPLKRSNQWRKVRKAFIKKHKICAVCGGTKKLQVHHIKDFSTHPELELDENNLIVLCVKKRCHLLFGHLNDWKSINPDVVKDAEIWSEKIRNRRSKVESSNDPIDPRD